MDMWVMLSAAMTGLTYAYTLAMSPSQAAVVALMITSVAASRSYYFIKDFKSENVLKNSVVPVVLIAIAVSSMSVCTYLIQG
jgi:hypothetical protein